MRISTADGDTFVIVDRIEPEELKVRLTPWMHRLGRDSR
jgi:hypothetical protein